MRNLLKFSAACAFSLTLVVSLQAQTTYFDAVADEAFPNPHLDITSVEINNTATDILFRLTDPSDPCAARDGFSDKTYLASETMPVRSLVILASNKYPSSELWR